MVSFFLFAVRSSQKDFAAPADDHAAADAHARHFMVRRINIDFDVQQARTVHLESLLAQHAGYRLHFNDVMTDEIESERPIG